ncbi:peptide chain release factor N(5)-glutamine methyltransferase [Sphingomonas psychrotolerans]|uniref:Release factor glutamine methyltransferase n=1 Tax=Sphingomonas psychrotolerans TaxID=1327635 RepID=A0A2K8ML32_9SPHN|nr:peptide chain release factor N(5)-glutamine methyltransferase [Sphingomonas psychrotolerans]ATY34555.1 peptide chain release factor N(5)-glutamine methyltransferase [Sphingomonas psychrotolerans]
MTAPPTTKGVRTTLAEATQLLSTVTDTARLDAELLMAHALGISRQELLLRHLDVSVPATFEPLLQRRLAHEPIAYITGIRAFWTIELQVGPGALIPRPDSETLIETAIDYFDERAPMRILDLGTGPGTLLLAALDQWPEAHGLGVDASEPALGYARSNADRLGMGHRAELRLGDWTRGLDGRQFDLILANPPYIGTHEPLPAEVRDHEPASALFAGPDGLDDYRRIIPALPDLLAPGGAAMLEIGWTQAKAVSALGLQSGLLPAVHCDLGGRPRVVLLT